jgi:hypothetical protein
MSLFQKHLATVNKKAEEMDEPLEFEKEASVISAEDETLEDEIVEDEGSEKEASMKRLIRQIASEAEKEARNVVADLKRSVTRFCAKSSPKRTLAVASAIARRCSFAGVLINDPAKGAKLPEFTAREKRFIAQASAAAVAASETILLSASNALVKNAPRGLRARKSHARQVDKILASREVFRSRIAEPAEVGTRRQAVKAVAKTRRQAPDKLLKF